MKYSVIFLANGDNSLCEHYDQAVEVYIDDAFAGGWYGPSFGLGHKIITILERIVEADFASQAMYKFKEWQTKGLPDSYLEEKKDEV